MSIAFFFKETAPPEIYTLSLHDALPISDEDVDRGDDVLDQPLRRIAGDDVVAGDRKSTRLNSSHPSISYAVFCLKKKKQKEHPPLPLRAPHPRADGPQPAAPRAALARER